MWYILKCVRVCEVEKNYLSENDYFMCEGYVLRFVKRLKLIVFNNLLSIFLNFNIENVSVINF